MKSEMWKVKKKKGKWKGKIKKGEKLKKWKVNHEIWNMKTDEKKVRNIK